MKIMKYESEYFKHAIIFTKNERTDVYIPCDVINALQHGFFDKNFLNMENKKMTILVNINEITEIQVFNHSIHEDELVKDEYICY